MLRRRTRESDIARPARRRRVRGDPAALQPRGGADWPPRRSPTRSASTRRDRDGPADHRQHRHRDVRQRPADERRDRSSPRRTRRCTRPRTRAATGCGSSTRHGASRTLPHAGAARPAPQVEHALGRQLELGAVERAGAQRRNQRLPGVLGRPEVGEEEEVGAGASGGQTAPWRGRRSARRRRVSSASVIETPSKPSRLRSSPVAIERVEGGRASERGRVDRGAQHHHLAAAATKRRRAPRRPRAARASRGRSAATAKSVFSRAAPKPGKCLAVAATPPACERVREGDRGGGDPRRRSTPKPRSVSAIAPPGPGHVEHRRQVDVDADVAQVGARCGVPVAAEGGAAGAHLLRRDGRRAADPLHQAALLVDHHQQRVAQRAAGAGSPAAGRSGARPAARAGKVPGEEDDAGDPPRRIASRNRGEIGVPLNPATIRSPASRFAGSVSATLGSRRPGAVAERDAEGEGPDRQAARATAASAAPPPDSARSIGRDAMERSSFGLHSAPKLNHTRSSGVRGDS